MLQDLDTHTQGVVEGIRRSLRERTYFDESELARKAFHYLRAFAIARGMYTNQQSLISERTFRFQELVKIANPESQASRGQNQENSVLTMSHYVSDFFNNLNVSLLSRYRSAQPAHLQDPEIEPTELLTVLRESEAESVNSKFGMMEYIQVILSLSPIRKHCTNLAAIGESSILGGIRSGMRQMAFNGGA